MPATVEALMIALVALMPGAIYTWSFERIAGRWGIGLSDRLYRFVGISAIFHVLIAPGSYAIWREHLRTEQAFQTLPLWMWGVVAGLVFVPGCLGTFVGTAHAKNKPWAKAVVGPTAAPTAWDAVFSGDPTGSLVLLRLKSGAWVGGEYAHGSYAGGFPEPTDLLPRQGTQRGSG